MGCFLAFPIIHSGLVSSQIAWADFFCPSPALDRARRGKGVSHVAEEVKLPMTNQQHFPKPARLRQKEPAGSPTCSEGEGEHLQLLKDRYFQERMRKELRSFKGRNQGLCRLLHNQQSYINNLINQQNRIMDPKRSSKEYK